MSNLDGYHPFRASVQAGSINQSTGNQSTGLNTNNEEFVAKKNSDDEDEYKPWFSWKTKLKMFIGGAAFVILYYVLTVAYAAFEKPKEEELNKEPSLLQEMERRDDDIQNEFTFDGSDLNSRGRTVNEARQKAGFLKSIFCRGGKRASFICD
jgi:hypothetical protein